MNAINIQRRPWKKTLQDYAPLVLPSVHDALSARLAERAGFRAIQVGGFAMSAALHAVPDIDLEHFGEKAEAAKRVIHATQLPVLVDGDDGYGDVKNVTRTVQEYETLGAAAIFIEDQVAPKRCGHMSGKRVVPPRQMTDKIRAAAEARQNQDFFILARTDAIEPNGLKDALRRGEAFLKAGADGLYFEGPRTLAELRTIGRAFTGVPLAVSILEGGGKTPWLPPDRFLTLGFTMLLYPTTVLFRAAKAIERAMTELMQGRPLPKSEAYTMEQFEDVVDMKRWRSIEARASS